MKNSDNAQSLTLPVAGTAIVSTLLTQIPQGNAAGGRIGRKVQLKKLTIRYSIFYNNATIGASHRVKIVYDKQCNGVAPVATDVLTVDDLNGLNNLDNSDRFITLYDETESLDLSSSNNFTVSKQINRKLDLEQIWMGGNAGSTIAQLLTGSVYLLAWSGSAGALATASTLGYTSRVRYVDN